MVSCLSAGLLPGHAAASGFVVGQADELVADDLVREAQVALQLVERAGRRHDVEEDVVALFLLVDLVGEAPLPPPLRRPTLSPPAAFTWSFTTLIQRWAIGSSRSPSMMTPSS